MEIDTLITAVVAATLVTATVLPYYRRLRRKEAGARAKLQELQLAGLDTAATMHPHFDALACIGCGSLPGRRCHRRSGGPSDTHPRIEMCRPRPLCGGLPGRGNLTGDGPSRTQCKHPRAQ